MKTRLISPHVLAASPDTEDGILTLYNGLLPRWHKDVPSVVQVYNYIRKFRAWDRAERSEDTRLWLSFAAKGEEIWLIRETVLGSEWLQPYIDWIVKHTGIPARYVRFPESFTGIQGQVTHYGVCSEFKLHQVFAQGVDLHVSVTATIAEQTVGKADYGQALRWLKVYLGNEVLEPEKVVSPNSTARNPRRVHNQRAFRHIRFEPALARESVLKAFWFANQPMLSKRQRHIVAEHEWFLRQERLINPHPWNILTGQTEAYNKEGLRVPPLERGGVRYVSWEDFRKLWVHPSVENDAETASDEELEAAAEILART